MITEVTDYLKANNWKIKLILENKQATPLILIFSSLQLHEFALKGSFMYAIYVFLGGRGAAKYVKKKNIFPVNSLKVCYQGMNPSANSMNCLCCSW